MSQTVDNPLVNRSRLDWFVVSGPVGRRTYMIAGFSLALFKYAIEFFSVWWATGQIFTPIDFVNPWLSSKAPFLVDAPAAGIVWMLFTIPFVWIAVAMSVRRAADIGVTPWIGLLMLVPLLNLLVIAILASLPSGLLSVTPQQQAMEDLHRQQIANAFRPSEELDTPLVDRSDQTLGAAMLAIVAGCVTLTIVGMVSVWALEVYGFILFFSSPVVAGAVAGFTYNYRRKHSGASMFGMIVAMNIVSFFVMLLAGLDGAICLIMAFPMLGPLSFAGAIVGRALATARLRPGRDERPGMIASVIILPLCLALEPLDDHAPIHQVTTSIDIAASPDIVWNSVTHFPPIDAPLAWYFRAGIAAPLHATIDGHGVGAVRRCNFTTGTFVEPITAWHPGERLAFDVIDQPHPMREWSPFPHLHPPHLESGFVSRRGEFRLEPLPGGGTRLHGTTWYEIDVRPRLYWKSIADPMLHSIHRRVLEHIATQSEMN